MVAEFEQRKIENPIALIIGVEVEVEGVKPSVALVDGDYGAAGRVLCFIRGVRPNAIEPRR